MQVIFHCGAHDTEENRLLTTLQRNNKRFRTVGAFVPEPDDFRPILRERLSALDKDDSAGDEPGALWKTILKDTPADRVIFSNPHFFGSRRRAVAPHLFYPEAELRLSELAKLFPYDQIELFMCLRNPASLLPTLLKQANRQRREEILEEVDPYSLRWSELVNRLRDNVPQIPITVWCFEDLPLIWAQIIRDISGMEMNDRIDGGMDLLASIMTKEGMKRLRDYLGKHPEMTENHRRRVFAAFLDKFARDEEIEEEIDLPGWTAEMVDYLGETYEEDIRLIEHIPGVTLIAP